jgi:dihydroorotase-like cyclic amidohydrolase
MDLIIRNARLADRRGEEPLDIAVAGGKIVAIERSLAGRARSMTRADASPVAV